MMRRLTILIGLLALSAHGASALTSAISDEPLDADIVDGGPTAAVPMRSLVPATPIAADQAVARPAAPPSERSLSANPLWAIPLTQLSGTRDRPIFSSSRRPPAAAATEPALVKAAPPPKPREPERPQLSLVGTIASDDEAFGIFLDQSTKAALRLKVGEDYQGWRLRSIQGREATLEKDQQAAVLSLPQPGGEAGGEIRVLPPDAGKSLSATSQRPPLQLQLNR